MGLHELAPVGGRAPGRRDGWWLKRFAQVREGLTSRGRSHPGLLPLANLRFEVGRLLPAVSSGSDIAAAVRALERKLLPHPGHQLRPGNREVSCEGLAPSAKQSVPVPFAVARRRGQAPVPSEHEPVHCPIASAVTARLSFDRRNTPWYRCRCFRGGGSGSVGQKAPQSRRGGAAVRAEAWPRGKSCDRGNHGRTGRWTTEVNSHTIRGTGQVRHQPIARLGGRANEAGPVRFATICSIPDTQRSASSRSDAVAYQMTQHAADVASRRGIQADWIARTLNAPGRE